MNKNEVFAKMLLSRPYTLPGIIVIGIISQALANNSIGNYSQLSIAAILSAIVWFFSMYFGEYLHNKTNLGRPFIKLIIPFAFFLLLMYYTYLNPTYAIVLAGLILGIYIYSLKIHNTPITPFAFLFRGVVELAVILLFVSLDKLGSLEIASFVLTTYLVTISRNLVGDLRDIESDKYTFAKKFGVLATRILAQLLLMAVILINPSMISLPLLAILFLSFVIWNYYIVHNLYVLSTLFFFINYLFSLEGMSTVISNAIYIGMLLNYSYHFVQRKANKNFISQI